MECNGPIHSSPWLRPLETFDELLSVCGGRSLASLMTVNIYSIYSDLVHLNGAEIERDSRHKSPVCHCHLLRQNCVWQNLECMNILINKYSFDAFYFNHLIGMSRQNNIGVCAALDSVSFHPDLHVNICSVKTSRWSNAIWDLIFNCIFLEVYKNIKSKSVINGKINLKIFHNS